uniref:Uncharacterized protein n=1 Tax=Panagrolaimus superbus TaxID=310955 RepID=A0A914YSI2_9BILA
MEDNDDEIDLDEKDKSDDEEPVEDEEASDDSESIGEIDEEMNELENELFGESEEDNEGLDEDLEDDDGSNEDEDIKEDFEDENEPVFKEDIYGRKVDTKTGKVIEGTSAARAMEKLEELNKNSTELAEQRSKIAKTLRGSINRLNESTLIGAVKSLEELFSSNSHNGKDLKSLF